jgi:endonuclease YncB( thermonuclease family)
VYALADGRNVNVALVRAGAAEADVEGLGRSHLSRVFQRAQTSAKRARAGIWKACG